MNQASGTFEVKLNPQPLHDAATDLPLNRLSIDKKFQGDLEGVSTGEMLSAMTAVEGSAGYVAMELVFGALHGKTGSFVLQHLGTVNRGVPQLQVSVVPDSGTGDLAGLSGTMSIEITDGKHLYNLDYTLSPAP